jgi:hypothetical protein
MESTRLAQVLLDCGWLGLHGGVAAPVILALDGWEHVYPLELNAGKVAVGYGSGCHCCGQGGRHNVTSLTSMLWGQHPNLCREKIDKAALAGG